MEKKLEWIVPNYNLNRPSFTLLYNDEHLESIQKMLDQNEFYEDNEFGNFTVNSPFSVCVSKRKEASEYILRLNGTITPNRDELFYCDNFTDYLNCLERLTNILKNIVTIEYHNGQIYPRRFLD